ncbi:ABC transporter ATP-binding protein [Trinickia mobilis]|uniref:ABC transporter ATP-binding protein n=1 Tax=Trinickia mobilis TaxID=2816356 RepID=UPI001A8E7432|nr:ABC transporter ATP-binding protein [Trinickia mobilis]
MSDSANTLSPSRFPAHPEPPLTFAALLRLAPAPLGAAIGLAVLSAALSLAPLWCAYRIVAALLAPVPDTGNALGFAVLALAAVALRIVTMVFSHVTAHLGAFRLLHRLRLTLARKLGEVPLSFFATRGTGSLRRTLGDDVASLEGFFAHMLPDAVSAAAMPLAAFALLFAADWRLALAALLPLPLALVAQRLAMRGGATRLREWSEIQHRIADHVSEYVRGVHVVKSFGLSARRFGQLAESIRAAAAWVAGLVRSQAPGWVMFTALISASLVLVAPFGAWLHLRGALDLPTYLLFLLVAPAVPLPFLRLTYAFGEQRRRAEALARINAVLGAPALVDAAGAAVPRAPLDIAFEQVAHAYGGRAALRDVSFTARAGELTAVVGASGAGKSTVARLVSRLIDADAGRVTVGGRDVRQWPLDALLERVATVFQDVHLFHGTVLDNLRLGRPGASRDEVVAAARAARAHAFIERLPHGYDTVLGERGARLSGGERQRLSIARALVKDAPILVLDEATAYADSENEALIQEALMELCRGRTVLMIAHRLHTVVDADRIVVLDAGHVVGDGRHDALLASCPAYLLLWRDHTRVREWRLGGGPARAFSPAGGQA